MGARWRVSDGHNISVKGESWLPLESNPYVISTHPALDTTFVSNLMLTDGFGWDLELLDDLFNDRDKMAIIGIPLLQNSGADYFYWFHDVSGSYTVKSL
ncbi:hypothetical protein CsatA_011844 [Cannabis sativa]